MSLDHSIPDAPKTLPNAVGVSAVEVLVPVATDADHPKSPATISHFLTLLIAHASNSDAKEILFKVAENPEDIGKDGFIDPQWLTALPENIASRVRKDGFLLKKFKEDEKEFTLEEDIHNRLWSVLVRGFLPLIASDFKTVDQAEVQSYVRNIFNAAVVGGLKRLPHYFVLQQLKLNDYKSEDLSAYKKELKTFIHEELMPQLLKLLNHKQNQQTPEIDLLKAMLESELDLITEAGRPALLHLVESSNGQQSFTCELPYTEKSIASYKRNGELANASYRLQGFVVDKEVKITSDQYRNASFDPYDLPDPRARFAGTERNLDKWIAGSVKISAHAGKLPEGSTKENPFDYLVTDVTLLSMLSESADGADPQDARRQIMNIFHAANKINARTEPMEVSVIINSEEKIVFVKPRVSVAVLAMNTARYFTSGEAEGIQNRALIALFEDLPDSFSVIYNQSTIPNSCLEIAGIMRNILGLNSTGRRAYEAAQANHAQLLEAYRNNTKLVDGLVYRQFELDALVIENISKYFSKQAESFRKLINRLADELEKDPANEKLLKIYNFAVDLHDLMDLHFTQTWQSLPKVSSPVSKPKGLESQYNGYMQANFLRMSQRVSKATTGHCNDGEDRRGFVAVVSKAYEDVAANHSGKTPRLYVESEKAVLDARVQSNMHTDASLGITYANNPAGGFEIHHRDLANKVSQRDLDAKMPELAKEPFRKAHKEKHAGGFKVWFKNLFLPLIIAFGGLLMTVPAASDLSAKVNDSVRVGGNISQTDGSTSTSPSNPRDESAPLRPVDNRDDAAAPLAERRRHEVKDGKDTLDVPMPTADGPVPTRTPSKPIKFSELYAKGSSSKSPMMFKTALPVTEAVSATSDEVKKAASLSTTILVARAS